MLHRIQVDLTVTAEKTTTDNQQEKENCSGQETQGMGIGPVEICNESNFFSDFSDFFFIRDHFFVLLSMLP